MPVKTGIQLRLVTFETLDSRLRGNDKIKMEIVAGVTPIQAAFEVMGLQNCQAILSFLFKETLWGAAIYAFAVIHVLIIFMKRNDYDDLLKFLYLTIALMTLIIGPNLRISKVTSAMEQRGNDALETEQVLDHYGNNESEDEIEIPAMMAFVTQTCNQLVFGVIATVDRLAGLGDESYLNSPFLTQKVIARFQNFIADGITLPSLRERIETFYHDRYIPALKELGKSKDANAAVINEVWPGHDIIRPHYSSDAVREEWDQLYGFLKTYVDPEVKKLIILSVTQGLMNDLLNVTEEERKKKRLNFMDRSIIELLSVGRDWSFHPKHQRGDDSKLNYWNPLIFFKKAIDFASKHIVGNAASSIGGGFAYLVVQAIIPMLPFIQGYSMLLLYSLFPVTMVYALFKNDFYILFGFIKWIFYVKSWDIVWAIIGAAETFTYELTMVIGKVSFYYFNNTSFTLASSVAIIMTPVISYIFLTGVFSGAGEMARAGAMYAGQGAAMVTKMMRAPRMNSIKLRNQSSRRERRKK